MNKILISAITTLLVSSQIFAADADKSKRPPPPKSNDKLITIAAGTAPFENVFKPIAEPFKKATGIELYMEEWAGDEALIAVGDGEFDLAANAMEPKVMTELLTKKKPEYADLKLFSIYPIGNDRTHLLIHESAGIKELSKQQLKDLGTGKVNNWKELGGNDLPIVTITAKAAPGTHAFWKKKVMDGEEWRKDAKEVADVQTSREEVSNTKGAWCLVPIAIGEYKNAKPVKIDVYGRPINSVVKGRPSEKIQKLYDFIRTEGKKYVK